MRNSNKLDRQHFPPELLRSFFEEFTLSRERTLQVVATVHIESARASSAAAIFALTFQYMHEFELKDPQY